MVACKGGEKLCRRHQTKSENVKQTAVELVVLCNLSLDILVSAESLQLMVLTNIFRKICDNIHDSNSDFRPSISCFDTAVFRMISATVYLTSRDY